MYGVHVKGSSRVRRVAALSALLIGLSLPAVAARAASRTASPGPAPCVSPADSWPMYQGDPTHAGNGCSSITPANVGLLHPAWFVQTSGPVTATPAVAFGSVFAGDYSGKVYSLNRSSGAEQWTFDTTIAHSCFLDAPDPHADTHQSGFGRIPASPATATIAGVPTVYVAAGGSLYALDAATGSCIWAQDTDPGQPSDAVEIESSPVVDTSLPVPEVLVGDDDNSSSGIAVTGLMAFDASTGALLWKYEPERDLTLTPAQFGGSDSLALSCGDGSADTTYCTPTNIPDLAPNTTSYADGCGDVWSSPALLSSFTDPAGTNSFEGSGPTPPPGWYPKTVTASGQANSPGSPDGLVVFGTGNCSALPTPATALTHGDYVDNEAVFGLDPVTGIRVWNFVEPYNSYDADASEPGGGDDDFGSSPVVASVPTASLSGAACPSSGAQTDLIIEGSKSGNAYGLCAADGSDLWSVQAAQPGELSAALVGAVGGFIGSPSLGSVGGRPTAFFSSAIPTPFTNDGIREPGDGDSNIASCPGLAGAPLLPVCPDLSLLTNPQRLVSLHAIDAATGAVVYQALSLPTYAATTYTNGVVFLPDSLATSLLAFDAETGTPLAALPLGGVPASAAAIAGDDIFLGSGEAETTIGGQAIPPQLTGIWALTTAITSTNQ